MSTPVVAVVTRAGHPVLIVAVKTVHTVIFAGELSAILWLVVSGWRGRRDRTVGLAAAAVAAEVAVFIANDGVCPITPLTERLGAAHGSVSDIFLPDALARTTPVWSTALLLIAGGLHARALLGFRVEEAGGHVTDPWGPTGRLDGCRSGPASGVS